MWAFEAMPSVPPEQLAPIAHKTIVTLLLRHPRCAVGIGHECRGERSHCTFDSPLILAIDAGRYGDACLIIKEGGARVCKRAQEKLKRSMELDDEVCYSHLMKKKRFMKCVMLAQAQLNTVVKSVSQPWQSQTHIHFPTCFKARVASMLITLRDVCNPHILDMLVKALDDAGKNGANDFGTAHTFDCRGFWGLA